jgi:cytochrome b6-f complex iron-sulfur subunit
LRKRGRDAPAAVETPKPALPIAGATSELSPRRRWLLRVWGLLGLAALAELLWVVASFVRPRRGQAEDAGILVAGPVDRFEKGSVSAFPAGKFYLVRLQDGGFLALHRECTHLSCTVPWIAEEARFACPCHASAFAITGEVLSPPAPRPLDLHPVRIENGIVKVDTRQRLSRTAFDPSQVVSS